MIHTDLSVLVATGLNFKDKTPEECKIHFWDWIVDNDLLNGLRWYIARDYSQDGSYDPDTEDMYGGYKIGPIRDWPKNDLYEYVDYPICWSLINDLSRDGHALEEVCCFASKLKEDSKSAQQFEERRKCSK